MQHGGDTQACAETLGISGDGEQSLGSGLEQQSVDHRLVVIGDIADRCRQGEHNVVVIHRQQVSLAVLQPAPGGAALALRTMPVAAGVVGDLDLRAVFTAQHVTTERGTAAALNGRHHLELVETDVSSLGTTPRRTLVAEDVRDLQRQPCPAQAGGSVSCSSGLVTSLSVRVATWL